MWSYTAPLISIINLPDTYKVLFQFTLVENLVSIKKKKKKKEGGSSCSCGSLSSRAKMIIVRKFLVCGDIALG